MLQRTRDYKIFKVRRTFGLNQITLRRELFIKMQFTVQIPEPDPELNFII